MSDVETSEPATTADRPHCEHGSCSANPCLRHADWRGNHPAAGVILACGPCRDAFPWGAGWTWEKVS